MALVTKLMLRVVTAAAWLSIGLALAGCSTMQGGVDRVMNTAVSPDGRTLAGSTVGERVMLFDLAPLRVRVTLTAEALSPKVRTNQWFEQTRSWTMSAPLAFSPDGSLLVAAGVDGNIVGWDVQSGRVRFRIPLDGEAADVAFLPDGRSFFVVGPSISRFSAETGRLLGELTRPGTASATSLAVSPDGKRVFVGLSTGAVAEYDTEAGSILRQLQGNYLPVTAVAVAPDGSSLASTAGMFDPRIWNLLDDSPLPRGLSDLQAVKDSAEQSKEAARTERNISVVLFLLSIASIAAMPYGVSAAPHVFLPTVGPTPDPLEAAATHTSDLYCHPRIAYSPDGRFVATTWAGGKELVVADVRRNEGKIIKPIHGCSVAFSVDSRLVITGGPDAPQIWDADTGQRLDRR